MNLMTLIALASKKLSDCLLHATVLGVFLTFPLMLCAQTPLQVSFKPLTQDILNNPAPEDWLMWRGNYSNWGYSKLDQIDRDNVGGL